MDPTRQTSPLRVLLVEDDEHDRLAFSRALQKSQVVFQTTECERADEALKRIHADASSFDLVVIDHGLPGMSGLHLCMELLDEQVPLPMVILTGQGSQQLAIEALKAGVADYMVKDPSQGYLDLLPVVLPEVVRKHGDRLARKRAEEALQKAHDELEQRVEERTAKLARATEQLRLELTERERVEESLRQSEERFRSVAQTASDGIIAVDSQGNIVFWNDAAEKIFGYSSGEAVGKRLAFIMPERFRKDHGKGLERVVSTETSGIIGKTFEKVGLKKNGTEFPAELSLAGWKTKEGVFFTGIVRDVTARKRAEEEIRHLSRQLISVMEEERKRLARDLHDEFGQALTSLHLGIEALSKSLPKEEEDHMTRCLELIQMIEQLGETVRNTSSELRPDMLDHLGLVPTLQWYMEDFVKRKHGPQVDFQAVGVKKRSHPDVEIVVYRILQEAMNNILRHSKAKHVTVLLAYSHPKLILTIKDDGVGFKQRESMLPFEGKKSGIGLLGMRERVGAVGGNIEIRSSRGKGTVIRAELPATGRIAEV